MSDAHGAGTGTDHPASEHVPAAHGSGDGHADPAGHADPDAHGNHGDHAGDTLGPIDWRMWLVGALGVAIALVIVAAFVIAAGWQPAT
jgi:hypothetical protein